MADILDQIKVQFQRPDFDAAEAKDLLGRCYGTSGALFPLVGERDQNFRLETADGRKFVVKISSAVEEEATVDLQVKVLSHVDKVAPALPIPKGCPDKDGALYSRQVLSNGQSHLVRLVTYLDGTPLLSLGPGHRSAIFQMGRLQGQICQALCSFFHPASAHAIPWNSSSDLMFEPELVNLLDHDFANKLTPHMDRLATQALPAIKKLRSQVIHNDAHTGNVLLDPSGRVCGLIDFGDLVFAPVVQELASSATSLAEFYPADPGPVIAELVQGFETAFPLLPQEREQLGDAILLRSLLCVELCELKARRQGERPHDDRVLADCKKGLAALITWHEEAGKCRPVRQNPPANGSAPLPGDGQQKRILGRRRQLLSPSYHLFYDEPLHLVRGSGVTLYDGQGRAYLDAYNNVPSVGHCHPHVVAALQTQAARLNIHTRYLHENVLTYAERLTATLPLELDTCIFVCTGTEANDLAYQIARSVTGREGAVVSDGAYHGNSFCVSGLSPYGKKPQDIPAHVATIPVPDLYRGPLLEGEADVGAKYAELARAAIDGLARSRFGLSMLMIDSIFDAPGTFTAPDGYLRELFALVRGQGGLIVADEVQSGLCRLGDHVWGFQDSEVVPDIVTMGKPMGDGHPIGAVVAKKWVLEKFAEKNRYFNTFGGNPVSAAVGTAVLDVVESEDILGNVHKVGRHLKAGLQALMDKHEIVGNVRGKGFFLGVDLVTDRASRQPAPQAARAVTNIMCRDGVLVTVNGYADNVIKIRPPLVFSLENADHLLAVLESALTEVASLGDLD